VDELPLPALAGEFQLANAATAIMALKSLRGLPTDVDAIKQGLRDVRLPGRFQIIRQLPVVVIVDVAHNLQAAESLVSQLRAQDCTGRTCAVVAMLADKPVANVIEAVSGEIDCWYTAGLESVPRGLSATHMADAVERLTSDVKLCAAPTVARACEQALADAADNDRIIIFGSFYTVAEAMQFFALHIY
jgi:dihydrofolate synthase/folylpolyglutamate synthase